MIVFRHADARFPFLWEHADQPAARWHGAGEGPVQYLTDTPDGAWAEFVRHEEIRDPADLPTVRRAIWAVEISDREAGDEPSLPAAILLGGLDSYPRCQAEARRLRDGGATRLAAPSAALVRGGARGWRVHGGQVPGADRDGRVTVLFGARPQLTGWQVAAGGRPEPTLLERVSHFDQSTRSDP